MRTEGGNDMNKHIIRLRTCSKAQAFGKPVPCKERTKAQEKRCVIGCGLLRIIAVLLIGLIAVLLLSAVRKPKTVVWREYIISGGDTVWSIAREEYGDSVDIRRYTDMIISENGIDAGRMHPGDVILIPMEVK